MPTSRAARVRVVRTPARVPVGAPAAASPAVVSVRVARHVRAVRDPAVRVVADVPVAAGADRPLVRELRVAADIHGESGMDGPVLPDPSTRPVDGDAVDLMAALLSREPHTLVPTGPLTNVARLLERHPDAARNIERVLRA